VSRVVFAAEDPHVGKGGAARLGEAGIAVERGVRLRESAPLVEPWLHFVRTGRPFFHLKSAITLNGRLTRGEGGARWITGDLARAAVHRLRRRHPATVIGIGTALADDPLLTVRDWPPEGGPPDDPSPLPWPRIRPLRVVLDSRLRLPPDSRLAKSAAESPILVLCGIEAPPEREAALAARGVEVERVSSGTGGLDLAAVADRLAARGVTGAFVEPGPALARELVTAGMADRWTLFVSPDWETAPDALPLWADASGIPLRLRDAVWETHGPDVSVSGLLS
jgi:diaminohydroxyphosphoribosylaminopyrimidine deaminase/5-amino-6-(5-phosphoribosylamino)uracil reductase